MQGESRPRTLSELLASDDFARLAKALNCARVVTLDQIQRHACLWKHLYADLPPRRRRQFIRSDLERLHKAGYLTSQTALAIWPAVFSDPWSRSFSHPILDFATDGCSLAFHGLARELYTCIPEGTRLRKVKLYFGPTKELPVLGNDSSCHHLPHSDFYDNLLLQLSCEREQLSFAQHKSLRRVDCTAILSRSVVTAMLALAEAYCVTASQPLLHLTTWELKYSKADQRALQNQGYSHRPFATATLAGKRTHVIYATGLDAKDISESFASCFSIDSPCQVF